MPRKAPLIPHVADWIATLSRSQAEQYGPAVRTFFAKRADFDASTVEHDEVVDYCTAIESTARPKVCAGLDRFFAYLDDAGKIPKHPAPRLSNRVRKALERRHLELQLRLGGVTATEIATLRWRDVMLEIASPAKGLPAGVPDSTVDRLVDELLDKLQGTSSGTVAAVLDSNVLP